MRPAVDVVIEYDDPIELARLVTASPRPLLIGLDVDGVLAPLVAHADDAVLLDGVSDAITAASALDGVHLAVISGRALDDLGRFGFAGKVDLIGSHGIETSTHPMDPLDAIERARLARLDHLTTIAVDQAGDGAWIERKPASVVLHVREADDSSGANALEQLSRDAGAVDGALVKAGSNVLELFARAGDKGTALLRLAAERAVATTVFVGDDLTDEEAFARLGAGDVAIKVGDADTIARHRLADPAAVRTWLAALR